MVTRQNEDTKCTLTAEISLDGYAETRSFDVTVKAKPSQDYLEKYLFAFFPDNSHEQLYFASGEDPLHFTDLNDGNPVLTSQIGDAGIRDPYIFRSAEGDKIYIIATDLNVAKTGWGKAGSEGSLSILVWETTDLVNWDGPRLVDVGMTEYENIGCVWAPEAIYDDITGEYVVFWASATGKENAYQIIYYSKTRDFVHFTRARKYIDRGRHCIDTSMVKTDDGYYRVSADTIMTIERSDTILGEWEEISTITDLHKKMNHYSEFYANTKLNLTGGVIEGPELFEFNEGGVWGLYADNYTNVGYVPMTTTDIGDTTGEAWTLYTTDQYHFGNLKKRHGSIIGITEEEYVTVMEKWGNMEAVTLTYQASEGGKIKGDTSQKIEKGKDGKTVTAIAREGYLFKGWSDGFSPATRQDPENEDDLTVTALFEKDPNYKEPGSDDSRKNDSENNNTKTNSKLPKVGTLYTAGGLKYRVTKSTTGVRTAEVKKSVSSKAKSLKIPDTVKLSGYSFRVTSIASNAFLGQKKLTGVTIGKNVTKIGAKAFYNDKKLKKLVIKSSVLKSVGKNAFKGTSAKLVLKVPSGKVKAYQKLLKKKGLKKTAKIK